MSTKMVLPFPLGRTTGGRAVTEASEIDDNGVAQSEINAVHRSSVVNVTQLYGLEASTFEDVLQAVADDPKNGIMAAGVVLLFLTTDGWECKQWSGGTWADTKYWTDFCNQKQVILITYWDDVSVENLKDYVTAEGLYAYYTESKKLYVSYEGGTGARGYDFKEVTPIEEVIYINGKDYIPFIYRNNEFHAIAPKNIPASIFNATVEVPIQGFYVLYDLENTGISAVHAAWNANKATSGLIMSFELSAGIWKTYQYIGKTITEANWLNIDNWKDFGSLAAGSEPYIIIDSTCGAPTAGDYYTLETAVARLVAYQETSGVTYAKKGLIISYSIAENTMETKQFQGEVSAIGEVGLWKDFGGGSAVETADEPEEDGTDALSTGGAYTHIPAGLQVDTETEGVIKMKMVNAAGEDVGDEVQFPVGSGSGGTGTTIAVALEENPFYGKAGGSFIVKAAIMSVTKAGSQETLNSISSVVFVNRTTKNTVASFSPRQASSSSLTDYSFEFDLSSLGQSAGELPLQAIVTDDGGNTTTKNFTLVSIDVTCVSVQTLNYTKETSLQVGGTKTSIPMYRFPNNASDKGIRTKIEMFLNGNWETLQEIVINDTYPHNVSIDPTGLGHGAYPIRIQGTDVASGTEGNVLHTAVMVIEQREEVADYDKPIIVARWSDDNDGKVKLFESVTMDIACFKRSTASPTVDVTCTNNTTGTTEELTSRVMQRNKYYTLEKRIVGYDQDDELEFDAMCGDYTLIESRMVQVDGSLLDIAETEGALYKIGFEGRSNADTDKSIHTTATDGNEIAINVHGSNYSTNGFVLDSFGTEETDGRMSLRIAENMTAECTDTAFASNSIALNGLALSMSFKIKNIADRHAHLIKCMGERLGFVLTGEKFYVTTNGDTEEALASVFTTAATSYLDDKDYRIDIVIEPQSIAPYSGIQLCKVYQNGDMSACVPIDVSSAFPSFDDTIHFYGTDADIYLHEIVRWNTYYDFIQAHNNYTVNMKDTTMMLTEYEQNDVMTDVTAEGTTKPRPDMQKLLDRGIMVCVETRTSDGNLSPDGSAIADDASYYPDYIEGLKDKKTSVLMDWYLYFPDRPWADCKVEAVPVTNQGTSTLAYPVKNKKAKFKNCKRIVMLHTREEVAAMYNDDETILAKYDEAVTLAAKKKIRIKDGSTPINIADIKVDYSDSAGANNCALMEQMNDVQIALGDNYITPAQKFNTDSSEELHTSIDGITCALFRTDYRIGQDMGSAAATLPENAYFHSKANFNADKGNPHFFGFEDVKGYNKGCVNYGDFTEFVTPRGTDIDAYKTTILSNTSTLVPGTLYMISEFCGPQTRFIENDGTGSMTLTDAVADFEEVDKTGAEIVEDDVSNYDWATVYKSSDGQYYKYTGGVWRDTTGTMTYDTTTKKWVIVGRVLNPVECFEYRQYQEFCWQQGVNSVDDMLETLHTDDGDVPIWTTYYESRYPDDDNLNDLYIQGKKVPYQLYRELAFCQQCNQNLTDDAEANAEFFNGAGASTTITLDGETVAGTKANRLLKWQHEMHKMYNPYSANCYVVASDYKATVDQRAKNMMKAVYLETDGTMRFYFNHWYDGDSVDEADNDCYLTIPWDMDGATSHLYQGWDGVMFRQTYALFANGQGVWIDDEGTELTLHDTAAAMRATKTKAGLEIFSADGCYRYWMTNRILKWPKVVSSFDGERKYIETATAADNHYPALHGLRLDSLPAFQRKRFAYRDGYFQTGDLFKYFFQARVMGSITVNITAAQDGYFGMGVDSTSSAKYSCYLQAGESYTFTEAAAGVGGKLIYIFGADKLAELDISGCSPKNSNWMISDCKLLKSLIIGGENYSPEYTDDILSALNLGQMPFLETLDIRNTKILTLNASGCPRLNTIYARGSLLRSFTPAESSPINALQLPSTIVDMSLVNLPNLTYPNGGLTFEGLSNVTRFQLSGCPGIDAYQLLSDVIAQGGVITEITANVNVTGDSNILTTLKASGAHGIGSDATDVCDGLTGTWAMNTLLGDDVFAELQAYFPNLTLINAQYTGIKFTDTESDPSNITNLDNNTGYGTGNEYVPSGHIVRIWNRMKAVRAIFNETSKKMEVRSLNDDTYYQYEDGSEFDPTDPIGEGYDVMLRPGHFWYKGINDYAHQLKYIFLSSTDNTPLASGSYVRKQLSELDTFANKGVNINTLAVGTAFTEELLTTVSNLTTYAISVEGMKQLRFPGVNISNYGAIFIDAENKVIGVFNMAISHALFDFSDGDYVFTNIPAGAVKCYFCCYQAVTECEVIATDSTEIEAIEPDWVEHEDNDLIGVYGMFVDTLGRARSVSGVTTKRGDGTSTTSANWEYDSDGNVQNAILPDDLHYTAKDFMNVAAMRGDGYQLIDYEQNKIMAIMFWALTGNRNDQEVIGQGTSSGYTTGQRDSIGKASTNQASGLTKLLGLEGFIACNYEWMDNIAYNVKSWATFKKAACVAISGDSVDYIFHIYDPISGTERTVKTPSSGSGCNVARIKGGRFCDTTVSKFDTSDSSKFVTYFCCYASVNGSTGRVVGRANNNAYAYGGLAYAGTDNASSGSYASYGSRLAFRGEIEEVDE